jgi:xanthine dehydrogenase YagT iron-sulfur-binding subunit
MVIVTLLTSLPPIAQASSVLAGLAGAQSNSVGPGEVEVVLKINGRERRLKLEPRTTLLDTLRERLGLTGTKMGCDRGQCGACTVLIEGRRVKSCLTLAVREQNKAITTIEGIRRGDQLHPMQIAFLKNDGFQCGFCTPGQIMAAVGFLSEPYGKRDEDIREGMSGNLCRCGAYDNIVAAVKEARANLKMEA